MQELIFNSPPSFPFTLEEALIEGASYRRGAAKIMEVQRTLSGLEQYFDKALGLKKKATHKPGMAPSLSKF